MSHDRFRHLCAGASSPIYCGLFFERGRRMVKFDPQAYGPVVAELLRGAPENALGPGTATPAAREALSRLTPEQLVAGRRLADRDMALACIAAIWLRHDYFDESHAISQAIETSSGSYWHGILHRRE